MDSHIPGILTSSELDTMVTDCVLLTNKLRVSYYLLDHTPIFIMYFYIFNAVLAVLFFNRETNAFLFCCDFSPCAIQLVKVSSTIFNINMQSD